MNKIRSGQGSGWLLAHEVSASGRAAASVFFTYIKYMYIYILLVYKNSYYYYAHAGGAAASCMREGVGEGEQYLF